MRFRNALSIIAVAALTTAAVAWWMRPSPRPRANVILITIDTLRPDRLSCYGYTKHHTPNLDRLAKEGVLFENAFCDVTWTTPSMASVMTGQYATRHGLRSSFERLSQDAVTLAELLAGDGIQTAAIVASYPLAPMYGLDQGFGLYDAEFSHALIPDSQAPDFRSPAPPGGQTEVRRLLFYHALESAYRTDAEVSDRAIRWLREEQHEPFFLWLHYFGPHEKVHPAKDIFELIRIQMEQYDPDVVANDAEVGRVLATLDELGLTESTAVIVHADHGQSLMEQYYFGHGRYLYDSVQRVPLIMRWPGYLPAGKRVSRLVRNIDLFPTILGLMQVESTVPVDGRDLLPLIAGKNRDGGQETYVETYLSATRLFADRIGPDLDIPLGFRRFGIRAADWKFIVNDPVPLLDEDDPTPVTPDLQARYYTQELYDLRADPGETVNVLDEHPDVAAGFRTKLLEYEGQRGTGSERVTLDDASRERLRSLGYLE